MTYNFIFKSFNDTSEIAKAKGSSASSSDRGGLLMMLGFRGSNEISGNDRDILIRYESEGAGDAVGERSTRASLDSSLSWGDPGASLCSVSRERGFLTLSQSLGGMTS